MAEKTTQTTPPAATTAPAPAGRRTVSMPVLPLAIVGGLIAAAIFFGGGVAVGFAISHHQTRVGFMQPFDDRHSGPFGGPNGFGQNGGQNRGPHGGPDQGQIGGQDQGQNGGQDQGQDGRPTPAPTNG